MPDEEVVVSVWMELATTVLGLGADVGCMLGENGNQLDTKTVEQLIREVCRLAVIA